MLTAIKLMRYLHTCSPNLLPRRPHLLANPGVARQMEALEASEPFLEDPEGFGDVETDFMHVHKSHKQLDIEQQNQRDKIRRIMIKNKYFREPRQPNLLTYAEKEQIRLLHAKDPEEWNVGHLAESFPATEDIIQKVIEAKWRPRNTKRIKAHDEAVLRNWEKLQSGDQEITQQLTPRLKQHLMKFSNRNTADLKNIVDSTTLEKWPTRPQLPEPKHKEFQSIVTSCWSKAKTTDTLNLASGQPQSEQQKSLATMESSKHDIQPHDPADETYLLNKIVDKRKMRLQELKQYKLTASDLALVKNEQNIDSESTDMQQKLFENPAGTGVVASKTNNSSLHALAHANYLTKFESSEIMISREDQKRFDMTKAKDRIYIPKKLRKTGATYRIDDCYYDDDGEFLYRVPGMS